MEFSSDNGNSWTILKANINTQAKIFNWQVPQYPSAECKVRLISNDNPIYQAESEIFTISGILLNPVTFAEICQVDSRQNISWNSAGISYLKLEYSTNNGSNWLLIDSSIDASKNQFNWIIPNTPSKECKLKLSSYEDSSIYIITPNIFAIVDLNLKNEGQRFKSGSIIEVIWESYCLDKIRIEYSMGGQVWYLIKDSVQASLNSYAWRAPDVFTDRLYFKISSVEEPSVYNINNSPISLIGLQFTSTNGYCNIQNNKNYRIAWDYGGLKKVNLYLSQEDQNNWELIESDINAGDSCYIWNIPKTVSGLKRLKITDVQDTSIYDISNVFRIIDTLAFIFKNPKGGEVWEIGSTQNITWTSNDYDNEINLEYSTDMGFSWTSIVKNFPNTGFFFWQVPNKPTMEGKIKISLSEDTSFYSMSDSVFTITQTTTVDDFLNKFPMEFALYQNYPNPFNPITSIRYSVPKSVYVQIKVHSIIGQEVAVLVDEEKNPGNYEIMFDGNRFESGVYIYEIVAGNYKKTLKLCLLK